eukprot:355761-Chlamydomonas_euryale.AAC.2
MEHPRCPMQPSIRTPPPQLAPSRCMKMSSHSGGRTLIWKGAGLGNGAAQGRAAAGRPRLAPTNTQPRSSSVTALVREGLINNTFTRDTCGSHNPFAPGPRSCARPALAAYRWATAAGHSPRFYVAAPWADDAVSSTPRKAGGCSRGIPTEAGRSHLPAARRRMTKRWRPARQGAGRWSRAPGGRRGAVVRERGCWGRRERAGREG